jgi:flavin-dependent dehydrogenase
MKTKNIVIIGGGSAGWMTAATLSKLFPNKTISLVESPNIPTVGVGESTIQGINVWLNLLGIKDTDFMEHCDATYKLSIKFENFYKDGDNGFHYPFGYPVLDGAVTGTNDWHIKKAVYPETTSSSYAESYFSTMALVNENKFDKNLDGKLPGYRYLDATAFHFDATKFANWLRTVFCKDKNIKHILSDVVDVKTSSNGVDQVILENGDTLSADLFIDCTGFKSLLLGDALKEPFTSYSDIIPNNKAWATRLDYTDHKKQMEPYTTCTALGNGWVWNIPLWSRIGTGYVYSDKFTTPEEAKQEFITHLESKGYDTGSLQFKNIDMRIGIHERIWVKNVCAIGLSAGFIEPLESNGLYTVHKFLMQLVRVLSKENVNRYEQDAFNLVCKLEFRQFAEFVAMHYALSVRDDTKYWQQIQDRIFDASLPTLDPVIGAGFKTYAVDKYQRFQYDHNSGFHCIAAGMNSNPCDLVSLLAYNYGASENPKEHFKLQVDAVGKNISVWKETVKDYPTMFEYLQTHIHQQR